MSNTEHTNKYGWWGKYESFGDSERVPVKIWIGPMWYTDMIQEYEQFRHFYREDVSTVPSNKIPKYKRSKLPASNKALQCPHCQSVYDVDIFKVCENCGHRWA